jgi:hypothetical protein
MPDRETLLPNKALHPEFWRHSGNPGAVLSAGALVAAWRPQKKGKRLLVKVALITDVSENVRLEIEIEAGLLAPFRECESVEVVFTRIE